jgi:hypothetical protein
LHPAFEAGILALKSSRGWKIRAYNGTSRPGFAKNISAMLQTAFIDVLIALMLISALAHLFLTRWVDVWLTRPSVIRVIGAILLALAIVSLDWRGWFFDTLAVAFGISGIWRLFFPQHSIHAQERLYPRRVHGGLLLIALSQSGRFAHSGGYQLFVSIICSTTRIPDLTAACTVPQ